MRRALIGVGLGLIMGGATMAYAEEFESEPVPLEVWLRPAALTILTPAPRPSAFVARLLRPTTARYLIAVALMDQDRRQTVAFLRLPHTYERNPLLGRHPSEARLLGTFAIVGLGGAWLLETLPVPEWLRLSVAESVIATEAALLEHNAPLVAGGHVRGFPLEVRITFSIR